MASFRGSGRKILGTHTHFVHHPPYTLKPSTYVYTYSSYMRNCGCVQGMNTCLVALYSTLVFMLVFTIANSVYINVNVHPLAICCHQDTAYPTFLYQVLEECWQQEQFQRPPSELLHTALTELTGLSVRGGGSPTQNTQALLLDSYLLWNNRRLSTVHGTVMEGNSGDSVPRFVACASLSSLDNSCTSIVAMSLSQQEYMGECTMETKVGMHILVLVCVACNCDNDT